MVGEHAEGDVGLRIGPIGFAGFFGKVLDQWLKSIGVENGARLRMNDDRGDALEAHARVNPFLGKRGSNARLVPVPRDEDQVPDLEEAIAMLAVRPAVRPPAAVLLAPVVVDLGVRPAGPSRTRGPEVVLVTKAANPLGRNAGLLPDLEALVIVVVNAGPEPLLFELQVLGQEVVRVRNRLFLEVVPKGEVAQHFEKGQVMAVV